MAVSHTIGCRCCQGGPLSAFEEVGLGYNGAVNKTACCFRDTVQALLILLTMVCNHCRRRLLTGRGWLVLSVPFYEYYILNTVKRKVHPCVNRHLLRMNVGLTSHA